MPCARLAPLLVLLGLVAWAAGCGGDKPAGTHAAEGHTHDGMAHEHGHGDGHGHAHDEIVAPEAVPIVRFEPGSDAGPHGGDVARLSSIEEPGLGWVEVKVSGDTHRIELWLARDRAFARPYAVPADAAVYLELVEGERSVKLAAHAEGARAARFGLAVAPAWWPEPGERELARVRVQFGQEVLVSDDFELHGGPPAQKPR